MPFSLNQLVHAVLVTTLSQSVRTEPPSCVLRTGAHEVLLLFCYLFSIFVLRVEHALAMLLVLQPASFVPTTIGVVDGALSSPHIVEPLALVLQFRRTRIILESSSIRLAVEQDAMATPVVLVPLTDIEVSRLATKMGTSGLEVILEQAEVYVSISVD